MIKKQKRQQKNQPVPPKTKSNSPNLLSTNLLDKKSLKNSKFLEKYHSNISTIAKVLIILSQVTYLLLLGYNMKLTQKITLLQNKVQLQEAEIRKEENTTKEIVDIISKTEKLKNLQNSRISLGDRLNNIIKYLPEGAILKNSSVENKSANIRIKTPTALDVSILMSNYFKNDIAQKITIKSADLSYDKTFTTSLDIKLK